MNLFNKKIKRVVAGDLEKLVEVQVSVALNLINNSHTVNQTAFADDKTHQFREVRCFKEAAFRSSGTIAYFLFNFIMNVRIFGRGCIIKNCFCSFEAKKQITLPGWKNLMRGRIFAVSRACCIGKQK